MTVSGPNYASGYANQLANGTWANQTLAQGSTTGNYCTWTDAARRDTSGIDYNGFGTWSDIPAGATIDSVVVSIKGYVSNTTYIDGLTARAFIGTTAQGSGATSLTLTTTTTNVWADITYTDITLAELQGNTLAIRITTSHNNSTNSGVAYFDYFKVTVNWSVNASVSASVVAGTAAVPAVARISAGLTAANVAGVAAITSAGGGGGDTPPSFAVKAANSAAGNATSRTMDLPTGIVAGSTIIAFIYSEDINGTVSPPDGTWTQIGEAKTTAGSEDNKVQTWWHRATGAESGTVTFTQTNANWFIGYIIRYSDVIGTGSPIDAVNSATATATADFPDVSITTTVANTRAILVGGNYQGPATGTSPTGFTMRGIWWGLDSWDKTAETPAASTTVSVTDGVWGASSDLTVLLFALRGALAAGMVIQAGSVATPAATTSTATVPDPSSITAGTGSTDASVTDLVTVAGVTSVPAASLSAGLTLSVVVGTASVPAPAPVALVAPSAATATVAMEAPTVSTPSGETVVEVDVVGAVAAVSRMADEAATWDDETSTWDDEVADWWDDGSALSTGLTASTTVAAADVPGVTVTTEGSVEVGVDTPVAAFAAVPVVGISSAPAASVVPGLVSISAPVPRVIVPASTVVASTAVPSVLGISGGVTSTSVVATATVPSPPGLSIGLLVAMVAGSTGVPPPLGIAAGLTVATVIATAATPSAVLGAGATVTAAVVAGAAAAPSATPAVRATPASTSAVAGVPAAAPGVLVPAVVAAGTAVIPAATPGVLAPVDAVPVSATIPDPTLTLLAQPDIVAAGIEVPEVTVLTAAGTNVAASVVAASATVLDAVLATGATLSVGSVASAAVVPGPTLLVSVPASVVASTSTVPTPVLQVITLPVPVAATVEIPTVSVTAATGTSVAATVVDAYTAIPRTQSGEWDDETSTWDDEVSWDDLDPFGISTGLTTTAVAASVAVPTADVTAGGTQVSATPVSASAGVPSPQPRVVVPASTVGALAAVEAPQRVSVTLTVATIQGSSSTPAPGVAAGSRVAPATVAGAATVAPPVAAAGSGVVATVVLASAAVPAVSALATVAADSVAGAATVASPTVAVTSTYSASDAATLTEGAALGQSYADIDSAAMASSTTLDGVVAAVESIVLSEESLLATIDFALLTGSDSGALVEGASVVVSISDDEALTTWTDSAAVDVTLIAEVVDDLVLWDNGFEFPVASDAATLTETGAVPQIPVVGDDLEAGVLAETTHLLVGTTTAGVTSTDQMNLSQAGGVEAVPIGTGAVYFTESAYNLNRGSDVTDGATLGEDFDLVITIEAQEVSTLAEGTDLAVSAESDDAGALGESGDSGPKAFKDGNDSAALAESASIAVSATADDDGTATSITALNLGQVGTDSMTIVEQVARGIGFDVDETAVATDLVDTILVLSLEVEGSDGATLTDSGEVLVSLPVSDDDDASLFEDTTDVAYEYPVVDLAVLAEAAAIEVLLTAADTGILQSTTHLLGPAQRPYARNGRAVLIPSPGMAPVLSASGRARVETVSGQARVVSGPGKAQVQSVPSSYARADEP